MAEWLYEDGIGEARAALVENGRIVEALVERDDERARAGAVVTGRLTKQLIARRRGIVTLESGEEALLEPIPVRVTEGALLTVDVLREAIPEAGRPKLAKVRATDATPAEAPSLLDRIGRGEDRVVRLSPVGEDQLEAAGWSELLEEAASGEIGFDGGSLRLSLTPAMTLIDVDGSLEPAALAVAGAGAAARAIRRLGIGGSIGIDLPTLPDRVSRQAAAAAVDSILPQPFERTAVNGFGFLQIVRPRCRASLAELIQGDPPLAAALALLRRAERTPGAGERRIVAAPPVLARIETRPDWIEGLSRRIGAPVALLARPGLAISAGHVEASNP